MQDSRFTIYLCAGGEDLEDIRRESGRNHESQVNHHGFLQPMATLIALLVLSLFTVVSFMFAS
jgi:hypothetical protein